MPIAHAFVGDLPTKNTIMLGGTDQSCNIPPQLGCPAKDSPSLCVLLSLRREATMRPDQWFVGLTVRIAAVPRQMLPEYCTNRPGLLFPQTSERDAISEAVAKLPLWIQANFKPWPRLRLVHHTSFTLLLVHIGIPQF